MISLGSTATNKTMRKNEQKGYIESGDSCMAEQQPSNHLTPVLQQYSVWLFNNGDKKQKCIM